MTGGFEAVRLHLVFVLGASCAAFVGAPAAADQACFEAGQIVARGVQKGDGSAEEENLYLDALKKCPSMAEAYYNLGVLLSHRGDNQGAAKAFADALSRRDDALFHVARGLALLRLGDNLEGKTEFEKALALDPNQPKATIGLAIALDRDGNKVRAREILETAAEKGDPPASLLFNLGALQERGGEVLKAVTTYERALQRESNFAPASAALGFLLLKVGRYEDARARLAAAAELTPTNPELHRGLGLAYERLGDLEKSELSFRRVLNLNADDVLARINIARLYLRKGQPSLAEKEARAALERDPANAAALSTLGHALLELGNYEESEKAFRRSIEIDATDSVAFNNLGVLLERTDRDDEAAEFFRKARALKEESVLNSNGLQ